MGYSILEITNGTTTVKLVKPAGQMGFHLESWPTPAVPDLKGGGAWRDSPLGDGRRMVLRRWANVVETINLRVNGRTQDDTIQETQDLRRLLEQARNYWLPRAYVGPVWIKAQADCETNPRYAYIYDYRTPGDDDPYSSGFADFSTPLFDGWALYLERGHWQDQEPGSSECQPLTGRSGPMEAYTYGAERVLNPGFETAGGGGADVFGSWTETAGTGAIAQDAAVFHLGANSARLTAGATLNTTLQQNINVVAGSTYAFSFWYRVTTANDAARFEILNITAGGNVVDLTSTPATAATTWSLYTTYFTVPAGCVQVGVLLRCSGTNTRIIHYDDLHLRLMTAKTFGQESTCANDVFIANKSQRAQLTHVYNYDAGGAAYSANLIAAALPFDLLPAGIAANDILYLGIADHAINYGPFTNVIFDLDQAAAGTLNGTWQYWDGAGASWTAIADLDDNTLVGTDELAASGVSYLDFTPVATWAETTVNGVYGYWIRLIVTAITAGAPQPQQQNRAIYTAILPYADLDTTDLPGGDIPALLNEHVYASVGDWTSPVPIRNFLTAVRSTERGAYFDPYLNFSDRQTPAGITVATGAGAVWATNSLTPTGRCITFAPGGAAGPAINSIEIASPAASSYYGAFRLMLRGLMVAAGDCVVQTTVYGPALYDLPDNAFAGTGALEVLDLGMLVLPTFEFDTGEAVEAFTIYVSLTTSGGCDVDLYDLVLIPVDEASAQSFTAGGAASEPTQAQYVSIDSVYRKAEARSVTYDATSAAPLANRGVIASGPLVASANADQRVYLFSLAGFGSDTSYSYPHHLYNPQLYRVARYLSMRGAR